MNRPDDIPEDVWEVACGVYADIVNDEGSGDDQQEIARALMRASARATFAERERGIRATVTVANEGGDTATCLSIAEELRCPDIAAKRAAIRSPH